MIEIVRGDYTEAVAALRLAERLLPDGVGGTGEMAYAYALANRPSDAERVAVQNVDLDTGPVNAINISLALGEYGRALDLLEAVIVNRPPWAIGMLFIKFNSMADPLLEEPDFRDARNRLTKAAP